MESTWVRDPNDPVGPPQTTEYRIETVTSGRWNESDGYVRFTLEEVEPPRTVNGVVVLGAKPDYVYSAAIGRDRMAGEMKSDHWGIRRWTAGLIEEPKDRANGGPVLLIAKKPDFPYASDQQSGSATIQASISPLGDVAGVKVLKESGSEFGRSAVAAVRQWKFLPAIRDGKAVPGSVVIPITFVMRQN